MGAEGRRRATQWHTVCRASFTKRVSAWTVIIYYNNYIIISKITQKHIFPLSLCQFIHPYNQSHL